MVTAGLNAGSSVPPVTDRDESDASLLRGGVIGGGGVFPPLPPPPPHADNANAITIVNKN